MRRKLNDTGRAPSVVKANAGKRAGVDCHPFITGERVYFRCMEEQDADSIYSDWLHDEEVTRYLTGVGRFPPTKEALRGYIREMTDSDHDAFFAVHDVKSTEFIGTTHFGPIDWLHRIAAIGIMIGNKEYWGKGYGTEVIRLVLTYAFERLNLHKVTAGIAADNTASVRAFKKAGFRVEGTAKAHFFINGKYCDWLYVGVLKDESLSHADR